jgi:hypothetical protein
MSEPIVIPVGLDARVMNLIQQWVQEQHGQCLYPVLDNKLLPSPRVIIAQLPNGKRTIPESVQRLAQPQHGVVLLTTEHLLPEAHSLSGGLVQLVELPCDPMTLGTALQQAWQAANRECLQGSSERCDFARLAITAQMRSEVMIRERSQRIEIQHHDRGSLTLVEQRDGQIHLTSWAEDALIVLCGRRFPQVFQIGRKQQGMCLRSQDLIGITTGRTLDVVTQVRHLVVGTALPKPQAIAQAIDGLCIQIW